VSRAQAAVSGPHWELGKEAELEDDWKADASAMKLPEGPYSRRPAVYLVKGAGGGEREIQVKVEVTRSKNVAGEGTLKSTLCGCPVEGRCPTTVGTHTVTVTMTNQPEAIACQRGAMIWVLDFASQGLRPSVGTTFVEVYFVLRTPTAPFRSIVWVEVLRFLCGRVGVVGENDPQALAARITEYCHARHGLRYETKRGAAKYGIRHAGGALKLMNYLARVSETCNCYDQAGAVQALTGALGATVRWCFLEPFGFINTTNLVGVGPCNNPFFRDDETRKVVPPDDPARTAFGNHAFCKTLDEKIVDACAGPHVATENPDEYIAASIDSSKELYWGDDDGPGRASAILVCPGVRTVG
jgi:hypothetical protein